MSSIDRLLVGSGRVGGRSRLGGTQTTAPSLQSPGRRLRAGGYRVGGAYRLAGTAVTTASDVYLISASDGFTVTDIVFIRQFYGVTDGFQLFESASIVQLVLKVASDQMSFSEAGCSRYAPRKARSVIRTNVRLAAVVTPVATRRH